MIPALEDVRRFQGADLGSTPWFEIDQERIGLFARATNDTRWQHVDPERAQRESPWKSAIADGYLLLALVPHLLPKLIEIRGWATAVNTGVDDFCFPGVVTAGSRVRLGAHLVRARSIPPNGARLGFEVRFEAEGCDEVVGRARVNYAYFA